MRQHCRLARNRDLLRSEHREQALLLGLDLGPEWPKWRREGGKRRAPWCPRKLLQARTQLLWWAGRAASVGARGVTLLSKPVGGYGVSAIAVLVSALSHACDPAENSWSLPPSAALMKRSARNTRAARLKCIGAAPHLCG